MENFKDFKNCCENEKAINETNLIFFNDGSIARNQCCQKKNEQFQ